MHTLDNIEEGVEVGGCGLGVGVDFTNALENRLDVLDGFRQEAADARYFTTGWRVLKKKTLLDSSMKRKRQHDLWIINLIMN